MMFSFLKALSQQGILGINNRNANYTLKYNCRNKYPIVDDKLKTKQLAIAHGIPVPQLYTVLEINRQIEEIHKLLSHYPSFVVKPACGSGGDGIIVISGRTNEMYRKASGVLLKKDALDYHLSNILSGLYSLGGQTDKVIVEYRVEPNPIFENISYSGVPDIRIIILFGVPVMSMVRLPTRMSDGKANLHQGAIGAGINIADGRTLGAVWKNEVVLEHPDTGVRITDIKIPYWDQLLTLASQCYELTELAYLGVDIVLDKDKGPMILELNARPGLNIQIANRAGLLKRLQMVEKHHRGLKNVTDRIEFSKQHFLST